MQASQMTKFNHLMKLKMKKSLIVLIARVFMIKCSIMVNMIKLGKL